MNKLLVVLFILSACAPLNPSVPKSQPCEIPSEYVSRYNSVNIGDSWTQVETTMGEVPAVEGDTQTYTHCKDMVFTFYGSVLVDKQIK